MKNRITIGLIAAVLAAFIAAEAFAHPTDPKIFKASGGGLSEATADGLYLKLDASNDPLTGTLEIYPSVSDTPVVTLKSAFGNLQNYVTLKNSIGTTLASWSYLGALSVPDLSFTGTTTTGFHPKSLTTAQRDAVSPAAAAGDMIYNSTTARVEVYDGAAWHARVRLTGDTMTGPLLLPAGTAGAPSLDLTGVGIYRFAANQAGLSANGTLMGRWGTDFFSVAGRVDVCTNNTFGTCSRLYLTAANRLRLENTTAAQSFEVFGTTTLSKYIALRHTGSAGELDVVEPTATTGASQAGLPLNLTAADAVASTDTAGAAAGGSVTITSGAAARNTSGNANGGNISLVTGAGIGTGTAGQVLIPDGIVGAPSIAFADDTDTGIYSTAANTVAIGTAGVLRVTLDGTAAAWGNIPHTYSGASHLYYTDYAIAKTATPFAATAANSGNVWITNEGTTVKIECTLPTAVVPLSFRYVVQDTDGIRITANSADTIRMGPKVTAAAGYIESTTIGSAVTIVAINATEWIATAWTGVWTDGTFTASDAANYTP